MLEQLTRNWWALALRGALAIIFGILALVWPGLTLAALVILFGAYALVDGVFNLIAAIRGGTDMSRGWLAVAGIAGILVGLLTFFWPGVTGLVLLMMIAAWAIVTGVLGIVAAIQLRKEIRGEWLYILGGALSVLFGLLLFIRPGSGALAVAWLIGFYAILFGVVMILLAFRVKGLGEGQGRGYAGGGATPAST